MSEFGGGGTVDASAPSFLPQKKKENGRKARTRKGLEKEGRGKGAARLYLISDQFPPSIYSLASI